MIPNVQVKPPESRKTEAHASTLTPMPRQQSSTRMFCSRPAGLPNIVEGKVLKDVSWTRVLKASLSTALFSMYTLEYMWKHCDLIEYPGAAFAFFQFQSPKCAATNRLPQSSSMHDSATQKYYLCNGQNKGKQIM